MTDEVVTRLYRSLVEELQRRGHQEEYPVKVSELYQTLVPYRSVRSRLGVELNADYEHALLRLLAGERGLLRLEPAEYREELRREVEAPYPFVGLFRKFSAADVWVDMTAARDEGTAEGSGTAEASGDVEASGNVAEPARSEEPAAASEAGPRERAQPRPQDEGPARIAAEGDTVRIRSGGGAEPVPARPPVRLHPAEAAGLSEMASPERPVEAGGECAFCGDELPPGRRVRFCPHCGGDQRLRPCPRCQAVLERDWRYCISCGAEPAPR